ncbi:isopenicillin N synthase family dioxygenase [Pseudonocardia endophytica]|uniref:Isopenicillin N synthase-like dioxygenase n=1 Tax=Pseudonocardia endophytica TaxID=401976 RepID=A0A4V2PHR2_PSEEN|nr:2-oxoglutarate and iron-dependent oxygenase domain-containing protein [Pseudonocardia endophytica]TCK21696.1 isopenicillin N synthase-like dioxygenase [Pseudonocardia endophytica]
MTSAIPVLSLDRARGADGAFDPAFTRPLAEALHAPGFVQLTGYGAAPGQVNELFAAVTEFFDRPLEDRLALDNRESPHFRGYTRLGHEITAGRPDAREQIDFGPELPPRPRAEWDAPYRALEGPNRWPDATVPQLRPLVLAWADLLTGVGTELTRALAHGLGVGENRFDPAFDGDAHWFGKLIRYVGRDEDGPEAQGVGPHADWGFLTLLLQDRVGGLQALPTGSRDWVDVEPVPGALVVNVGEMLQVATRGHLVATQHRVLPCPPGRTRQSIGFFWSPRLDATLETLPLEPVPGADEIAAAADVHARFGDNALRGWVRSHPEVAARHHPDLASAQSL